MGVQALHCSRLLGSDVVASAARTLPVLLDLAFGTHGRPSLPSRRAELSRGARGNRKIGRGSPRPIGVLCVCRAGVFDHGGYPGSQVEQRVDAFRSAPPELVEDEFFSRMMALDASRAPSPAALFEGSLLHPACEAPTARPSPGHGVTAPPTVAQPEHDALCALQRGGVQLPSSIKKLRRRKGEAASGDARSARECCAIKRAFSSMVYMIKAVQSHALRIRQVMFGENWDVQEVLHLVHKEMHSSFVWLFQRVFACTPKLMVSVMILLANFTVFSMGENLATATLTTDTPPAISQFLTTHGPNPQAVPSPEPRTSSHSEEMLARDSSPTPVPRAGSGGNFRIPGARTAEGFDDDSWLTSGMKEQVQLAREITTRKLAAPRLEADNYGCFDRTDLDYQLAISRDPLSPVLLANYAQFLFVVRHDHTRAEKYFHRAMEVDPRDATILDRFASFLWLGRGDRRAAERVYKAAMAAAPESSYGAGSYAHFLWHTSDGDNGQGPTA